MAEIFDIFGREFVSVIRHVHSLPGLLCCIGDSEIEADFTPYSLRAERERRQGQWDVRLAGAPGTLIRPESGPLFASRDHNLKLRYRLPVAAPAASLQQNFSSGLQ
jgi:hypothetical protein